MQCSVMLLSVLQSFLRMQVLCHFLHVYIVFDNHVKKFTYQNFSNMEIRGFQKEEL